ncbi:MAG: SAM-dependent methyltransferase [Hyphomicrobiales bacterium]|nr:SAM-dependent methyltransferase [Hyphomicrobiales bacterium]
MSTLRATELAHTLIGRAVSPGAWAIDATVGNGHDTVFLAGLVGSHGRVFGFDIQECALASAAKRLDGLPQVTLHNAPHERMNDFMPEEARGRIGAVMFNLGYLPGEDHSVTTRGETTIAALEQAMALLAIRGAATLALYTGHPGGANEAAEVLDFARALPAAFAVGHFRRLNTASPAPELLVIERLR